LKRVDEDEGTDTGRMRRRTGLGALAVVWAEVTAAAAGLPAIGLKNLESSWR
jgi:hypothetical protein